jgi:proline dehydrogenase
VLRSTLIALSQSERMRRLMTGFGPARRMSRRFVAGETLDEAIGVVRQLNQRGIRATLDHLGENVASGEDAQRAAHEYQALLERIAAERVQATISVKLTHVGLDFGVEFCHQQARAIVETAERLDNLVEIDIEGSQYTQRTLDVFHRLLNDNRNLRLALQAYLFRTEADLKGLVAHGSSVRLCKGAYDEPATLAWRNRSDVSASYARLMKLMFGDEGRRQGFYPALATHDHELILQAEHLVAQQGVGKDQFEFQMLYGVRRDWQRRLAGDGYRVRIYVPYGTQWYPYFMRRLAERPGNLLFMLRTFLGK